MARNRQGSLREFQSRLAEKLRVAATTQARQASLGIMVGQERYLVKLEDAGEIVPVPALTLVPLTRDWFRGVCNLRGTLHSVADISRFAGGGYTAVDRESRLLAMNTKMNFNAAILVSRMMGLKNTDDMTIETAANDGTWVGNVMRDKDGQTWRELNFNNLANNQDFLLVGRH
jgi:twitching motility protein PilI